jgi:hypothetical protein
VKMFAIVPKAIKAMITPQRTVMVCQSQRQTRCHQEEGEDTGCSGADAMAASFLNRLSLFLTESIKQDSNVRKENQYQGRSSCQKWSRFEGVVFIPLTHLAITFDLVTV